MSRAMVISKVDYYCLLTTTAVTASVLTACCIVGLVLYYDYQHTESCRNRASPGSTVYAARLDGKRVCVYAAPGAPVTSSPL